MIRGLRGWALASGLLLISAAANAAPPALARGAATDAKASTSRSDVRAQARAQVKKAQLDYKLARFEEALEDYSYAYELFPAPALLFNLGQCHRNLKNYERAIFFFEGYLREQPKIDPDQRALTEDLITECKTALERQRSDAAAAAARFAAPPMAAMTPRPVPAVSTRLALRPQPMAAMDEPPLIAIERARPPRETPMTHRWWFWTAVVGTALAAGAAAYYATGEPRLVEPSGSVGTLDRR